MSRKPKQSGVGVSADGYLIPNNARLVRHRPPTNYYFPIDETGRVQHDANLQAILAEDGVDLQVTKKHFTQALLLLEPKNAEDTDTVAVVINSRRIGYIDESSGVGDWIKGHADRGEIVVVDAQLSWRERFIADADDNWSRLPAVIVEVRMDWFH